MKYLLGIDIGTSGTKTAIFDLSGEVIASATREYPLHQPQNGWAEEDPEDWWRAVAATVSETVAKADPSDIAGVGLSGQMHGLVMLDGDGAVLRPSILWCDQRTQAQCSEIEARIGRARLIEITANPALTGFTASKILWVRENEPEVYERCRHVLLPKDYIRYRLTGEFATEVSDASGMQLLDVPGRRWSSELLAALDIDSGLLPEVRESVEVSGRITPAAAAATGLRAGTPVVGGAGDNAAAAVGTGVVEDGLAFATIGTSGVVYSHTSKPRIDQKGRVHTFCSAVPGEWHVMSVSLSVGLSLQWFRNNFCAAEVAAAGSSSPYEEMTREAAAVPPGCDRLIFLPYLMGERTPHLDPDLRGAFIGLSAMHTKAHLIRAVMEGATHALLDGVEILRGMGIGIDEAAVCGGGGRSELWRGMLADMFRCPTFPMASDEGPALGVALLAGVGAGEFASVSEACRAAVRRDDAKRLLPDAGRAGIYARYHAIYDGLYERLKVSFKELSKS